MPELNPDQFKDIAGRHILSQLNDNLDGVFDKYENAFNDTAVGRFTNSTPRTAETFMNVGQSLYNAQDSHDQGDPSGTWYHLNELNDHLQKLAHHVVNEDFEGRVPADRLHNLHTEVLSSLTHVKNAKHSYSELYKVVEPPKEGE